MEDLLEVLEPDLPVLLAAAEPEAEADAAALPEALPDADAEAEAEAPSVDFAASVAEAEALAFVVVAASPACLRATGAASIFSPRGHGQAADSVVNKSNRASILVMRPLAFILVRAYSQAQGVVGEQLERTIDRQGFGNLEDRRGKSELLSECVM